MHTSASIEHTLTELSGPKKKCCCAVSLLSSLRNSQSSGQNYRLGKGDGLITLTPFALWSTVVVRLLVHILCMYVQATLAGIKTWQVQIEEAGSEKR